MTTNPNDILPFRVYEVRNLGSVPAYVYLGKTATIDQNKQARLSAPERERLAENCYNIFLWASLVGGKGIRIDPATNKDPHTFIDQRWYDLRPFRYYISYQDNVEGPSEGQKHFEYYETIEGSVDETIPPTNPLSKRDELIGETQDRVFRIRRIISNGTVIVNANERKFWWGEDAEPHGELQNINPTDLIELQAHEFRLECENVEEFCPIKDVDLDTARDGRRYTIKDLEVDENVALFENDRWLSSVHGLIEEDLSDLIPEGVIDVSFYGDCLLNYCNVDCTDYGFGCDINDTGGFIIKDGDKEIEVTNTNWRTGKLIKLPPGDVISVAPYLPSCIDLDECSCVDNDLPDCPRTFWRFRGASGALTPQGSLSSSETSDLIIDSGIADPCNPPPDLDIVLSELGVECGQVISGIIRFEIFVPQICTTYTYESYIEKQYICP